jgi:hypothetical protein
MVNYQRVLCGLLLTLNSMQFLLFKVFPNSGKIWMNFFKDLLISNKFSA